MHRTCLPLWVLILCLWATCPGQVLGADYAWPLKRFVGVTSLFGDYRPGRIHAGLDLRTDGQVGWPVQAVGDGYIMRVGTSYVGYGRVLYLALDDGRVAVYGHLSEFGPQVTERVEAEQIRSQRYQTQIYFKENELRVQRGTVIARSGETGAGAPHLHFELRTPGNKPLNPEWQGFAVPDKRDPEIAALWVLPQYAEGHLGVGPGGIHPIKVPLSGGASAPLRPAAGPIHASGPVGFAVEAYDRKPNSEMRHNISGLCLLVNGDTLYQANFDTLDYETMSQVRLERPTWLDPDGNVYTLFKSRGNEMTHSGARSNQGFLVVAPGDSAVPFEIVVTDGNRNRRTIRGTVAYREPELLFEADPLEPIAVHAQSLDFLPERARGLAADLAERGLTRLQSVSPTSNQLYRLEAADVPDSLVWYEATEPLLTGTTILTLSPGSALHVWLPDSSVEVTVPPRSVYEKAFLTVRRATSRSGAPMVHVGPADLVLKSPLTLSFLAPADTRMALYSMGDSTGRPSFVENRRKAGRIECLVSVPASYTFAIDSIPPVVRRVRPAEDAVVGKNTAIFAHLEDNLSGVGNDTMITVRVDGVWLVPEFDPERRELVAWPFTPWKPGRHSLEVEVYDWAGQVTRVRHNFQVK